MKNIIVRGSITLKRLADDLLDEKIYKSNDLMNSRLPISAGRSFLIKFVKFYSVASVQYLF